LVNSLVPKDVGYKSTVDFSQACTLKKFDQLFRTHKVAKKQAIVCNFRSIDLLITGQCFSANATAWILILFQGRLLVDRDLQQAWRGLLGQGHDTMCVMGGVSYC
jgi:hypothetical protein